MEVLETREALADWIGQSRNRRRTLVPTMGALHRGHASLLDIGRSDPETDDLVATIFVNPIQFGPNEDFEAYPRPIEADLAVCREHGVDAVFVPTAAEMYRGDASISIHESALSRGLCGASRPGHFDGVCTVVAKLFHLVQPAAAVFGEKDYQQLAVIRRMVRDLDFPIRIVPGPTVREEDGLALSSRNVYLAPEERAEAPVIRRALIETAAGVGEGRVTTPEEALAEISSTIRTAKGARIDYVAVVDAETLEPLERFGEREPRFLAAVFFGKTRLIDNVGLPPLNG